MERRFNAPDDLTRRIDYIRDWLDKAETAIRGGNMIEAVAKLALAKADAKYLITTLVPLPALENSPSKVVAPSASLRRLSMILVPMALLACFFVGMAMGQSTRENTDQITLNQTQGPQIFRNVSRPNLAEGLLALKPITDESTSDSESDAVPAVVSPRPEKVSVSKPKTYRAPAPNPIQEPELTSVEITPAAVENPTAADVDEHIDVLRFGFDVIRSAQENMGN